MALIERPKATARGFEMSPERWEVLRTAYEAAYPRECCGVLLGVSTRTRLIVRRVINTLNAVSMIGGFAIPDHEMCRVRLLAANAGLDIVGVFHSHPSGSTELSSGDQAALDHSEWPWVIVTENPSTRDVLLTWHKAPHHYACLAQKPDSH
jgi:proteasome lid subunit RPN8/RPN11